MQTETDLTNLVKKFKKILPTIDSGDGFYYVDPDDCDLEKFFSDLIISKHQLWLSQLRKEIEGAIGEDESEKTSMHPTAASLRKAELRNKLRAELRTKLANLLQETK